MCPPLGTMHNSLLSLLIVIPSVLSACNTPPTPAGSSTSEILPAAELISEVNISFRAQLLSGWERSRYMLTGKVHSIPLQVIKWVIGSCEEYGAWFCTSHRRSSETLWLTFTYAYDSCYGPKKANCHSVLTGCRRWNPWCVNRKVCFGSLPDPDMLLDDTDNINMAINGKVIFVWDLGYSDSINPISYRPLWIRVQLFDGEMISPWWMKSCGFSHVSIDRSLPRSFTSLLARQVTELCHRDCIVLKLCQYRITSPIIPWARLYYV